jgi:hypothetical protein
VDKYLFKKKRLNYKNFIQFVSNFKKKFYFLIDVHNLFGYTQTIATHIAMLQARPSKTHKKYFKILKLQ